MSAQLIKSAFFDIGLSTFGSLACVAYLFGEVPAWIFLAGVLTAFVGTALTFENSDLISNTYIDSLVGPISYIVFGVMAAIGSLVLAAIGTANLSGGIPQLVCILIGVGMAAAAMTRAIGRSKVVSQTEKRRKIMAIECFFFLVSLVLPRQDVSRHLPGP